MNRKQIFLEKLIESLNQGWSIQLAKQKAKKDANISMSEARAFIEDFNELKVLMKEASLERKEEKRFSYRRGESGY